MTTRLLAPSGLLTRQIESSRLTVQINDPNAVPSTRWDRTSFITQVTLDGRHTFCGSEGGGSYGRGLCNEFGIHGATGFDETKPGEYFPKIGVGLLRRRDWEDYPFWTQHAVKPCEVRVAHSDNSLHVEVPPVPHRGYAVRLEKLIRVWDNRLRIEYTLENTGEKLIATDEYVHNFTALNGYATGAGYKLRSNLPWHRASVLTPKEQHTFVYRNQEIHWRTVPQGPFVSNLDLSEQAVPEDGWWWEMRHTGAGIGVRETVTFAPSSISLFFTPHAICPEVFKPLHLLPGQSHSWAREWRYFESEESVL